MGAVKGRETYFNWRSGSSHLHWALLMEHFDLFFLRFYLFVFDCVGSSLIYASFLLLWRMGATRR